MTPLQIKALAEVEKYFKMAEKLYGREFAVSTVTFDVRGATAGWAYSGQNKIRYNNELMEQNPEEFFARTIPHEIAHIVAEKVFGGIGKKVGHGPQWRRVMEDFGVQDVTRCHSYDVSSVKIDKRIYQYVCGCKTHKVGGKINNKIKAGAIYTCRSCRMPLIVADVITAKVAAVQAVVAPAKSSTTPVQGSKTQRARALYQQHVKKAPSEVIAIFMRELEMSKAGASTYYYNIKKAL